MGLDIYLYKTKDLAGLIEAQRQAEAYSELKWAVKENYDDYTENEKESIRADVDQHEIDLGLHSGGKYHEQSIELSDPDNSDHYFKIGYLRSSYNDGGINSILAGLNIPDLYYIFDSDREYYFTPDWQKSLIRCNEVLEMLKNAPKYGVSKYGGLSFSDPKIKSTGDALAAFLKEMERKGSGAYSNQVGTFYREDPPVVHAFIEGLDSFNRPCIYTIQDAKYDWYITAIEITKKTIEYVLSNAGDGYQYYFHWSG